MKICEREGCKKRVKRKPGPGKPPRFCSEKCAQMEWRRLHPYKRVYQEA